MSLITIGRDPDESVCKVCLSVFCTLCTSRRGEITGPEKR